LAVTLTFAGVANADRNIGCGFGTQIFEGKDDLLFQVLGATLNGCFGNQTFGISSNTLGCKSNQVITVDHRVNMFAGANLDRLAREMATGEGEALQSLAVLLKIQDADRDAFYQLTQENFGTIFPTDEITAGEMLQNLGTAMVRDPVLARYVQTS
jgi:hypothetical protein